MKVCVEQVTSPIVTVFVAVSFFSTIGVELFGSMESLKQLKRYVVYPGFLAFIPAVALLTIYSFSSCNDEGKTTYLSIRRSRFISINAILVLIPAAILLNKHAKSDGIDSFFYFLQLVELLSIAFSLGLALMNLVTSDQLLRKAN
ncbi:hypothetical protein L1D55_26755 [Vibrio sp. Isolate22]|uniref:hypothetical protein n=1 Tax=Vibrio sp. Isolate22 TaxID=2908532 RepID=UPI001EFCA31D|nr:hypothetical protein [Vibrio sp. Isolate22]MCG9695240.1 hypothetical protein [Vibrio sp. Isolate22]